MSSVVKLENAFVWVSLSDAIFMGGEYLEYLLRVCVSQFTGVCNTPKKHVLKIIADDLLAPMSSKMSMSFFLQSKRN